MSLDTLPVIEDTSAKLVVRERAEITFKSGKKTLAYVAGLTQDSKLIYDCDAVRAEGRWYIEVQHQTHTPLREITTYIPLRPLLEAVK
ncbi:MAG TPA: hypothetical protein VJA18_05715 [Candidatus Nanoarchaeia archaeon]|nr:hypothetical protein [Candidatus Nanoarchaeia archaeon]